jgi:hypothetical protein
MMEHQIYQSKRNFSQKSAYFLKSEKEPKIRKGTRSGSLKTIGLKLSSVNLKGSEKEKLKGKKVMRITKFADRRPTKNFCSAKTTFVSIKSSNSSRTSIKVFGFSVHESNTFITIVNRK